MAESRFVRLAQLYVTLQAELIASRELRPVDVTGHLAILERMDLVLDDMRAEHVSTKNDKPADKTDQSDVA